MERRADRKVRPLYFPDEILLLLVLELEGWSALPSVFRILMIEQREID